MEQHKHSLELMKNASTPTERQELQRRYGVSWSVLCKLPYFDIVKYHLIDPMHNFYLGTAKHMVKIWKDRGLLNQENLILIQSRIDELNIPYGVGRIPYKIGSNFSGLTADQWMNWTNLFSLYALQDILPPLDLHCWSLFVQASTLFRQYSLSVDDLTRADEKIMEFLKLFESHYGKECCTPNMHLHAHIKECILDFGPIAAFWTFPFERFNGILESFSKNWMKPEEQITRKFLSFQELTAIEIVPELSDLASLCTTNDSSGSLQQTMNNPFSLYCCKKNVVCSYHLINSEYSDLHEMLGKVFEIYFCDSDIEDLAITYSILYPLHDNEIAHIPRKHFAFYSIKVLSEHYLSIKSHSQRSAAVMAFWGDSTINAPGFPIKIGIVQYFFNHLPIFVVNGGRETKHLFAKVQWYQEHIRPHHFNHPVQLVSTLFESGSPYSFIPVSRFLCRCATSPSLSLSFDYGVDNAIAVCPHFIAHAQ